jgi:hypothetical protein
LFLAITLRRIDPCEPDIRDAVDLPDPDQLLVLSPVERAREFLTSELPSLLRCAVGWGADVELLPDDLLVDHPYCWPVRWNRQLDALLGQNTHQHAFEPQHRRLLVLARGFGPRVRLRRGAGGFTGRLASAPRVPLSMSLPK